jgi:hypothetical protein
LSTRLITLLALKGNQPTLEAKVANYFNSVAIGIFDARKDLDEGFYVGEVRLGGITPGGEIQSTLNDAV